MLASCAVRANHLDTRSSSALFNRFSWFGFWPSVYKARGHCHLKNIFKKIQWITTKPLRDMNILPFFGCKTHICNKCVFLERKKKRSIADSSTDIRAFQNWYDCVLTGFKCTGVMKLTQQISGKPSKDTLQWYSHEIQVISIFWQSCQVRCR